MVEELELRRLSVEDEGAFYEGLKAFEAEDLSWYTFDWKEGMRFPELLERLKKNEKGEDLPEGFVPNTMFYAFLGNKIIGRLHLRHHLSEALEFRGGHLGHAVAPAYRGKGYGSEILKLGLKECQKLGLQKVLITCGDKNVPSWRAIERAGGRDYTLTIDFEARENLRRYWLTLDS